MQGRHAFLLFFNFVSVLLYSGTIFGWTALSQIVVSEKFYSHLCEPPESTCDAQKDALSRAFTFASTATGLCALPAGWLMDEAGPFITILVGGCIEILSLLGLAMCEKIWRAFHFDFFAVCLVGLAVAGTLIRLCGYQCAFVFPRRGNLLIALASVLFDGSCMVFPALNVLYQAGVTFEYIFVLYAAFGVLVFIFLPMGWRLHSAEMARARDAANHKQMSRSEEGLASMPLKAQLRSFEFVVIFIFSVVQLPRSNLYLGSVDAVNEQIAKSTKKSDHDLEFVNTVVAWVIPLGFLAVPAITASIRYFGNIGSLVITCLLGVFVNVLQYGPSLYLQILTVCIFAVFRAFLFSNVPQFNKHYFGVLTMGRIQGICFMVGGLANLIQAPLITWSLFALKGDFRPLIALCLLGNFLPLAACVVLLVIRYRRASISRDSRDNLILVQQRADDASIISLQPQEQD